MYVPLGNNDRPVAHEFHYSEGVRTGFSQTGSVSVPERMGYKFNWQMKPFPDFRVLLIEPRLVERLAARTMKNETLRQVPKFSEPLRRGG